MAYIGSFLKRISLMVALLLFFGSVAAVGMGTTALVPGQYSYQSDAAGGVVITGYSGTESRRVLVPATLDGLPVTAVGAGAFWQNSVVVEVELPQTVTTLASSAFAGCTALEVVRAPGVCNLGDDLFYSCPRLTDITLGGKLEEIGTAIFGGAHPVVSVEGQAGVEGLLNVLQQLTDGGYDELPRGNVGGVAVTDEMLALYQVLPLYLGIPAQDVEMLWLAGNAKEQLTFAQYFSALNKSGLFPLLLPAQQEGIHTRMDTLIASLTADAQRLADSR